MTRSLSAAVMAALLLLSALSQLSAETNKKAFADHHSLAGEWRITMEDRREFSSPGWDDSQWDRIPLPGSFAGYALKKTGKPYSVVWLRKEVVLPEGMRGVEAMGLILGRIANADETYFNGERIGGMGGFPPDEKSLWNHPRHYLVPGCLIRPGGRNVIAIRVSHYVFGEVLGTLALTGLGEWERDRVFQNLLRIQSGYIIIAMGVPFFIIFLVFFITRREEEYLYYCLQLFFGFFIILELCSYWDLFGGSLMRLGVLGFSWAALNVAHPIFLHRIYRLQRPKTEILLWGYLVLMTGLLLSVRGRPGDIVQAIMLILLTIGIGFYNLSCHFVALHKKSPYARIFSFFGVVVILGALHDGLVYLGKFMDSNVILFGYSFRDIMIFPYAAAMLYTGTALVLVFRFMSLMDETEDLNSSLEDFVIENALLGERLQEKESEKRRSSLSLTERTEEKIERVISYIHENYLSDISREGLAASVDVHPDNLGKLFRQYTRKKLGDYICELRIGDAARMLRETESTVVDIAFATGFESLRTFNRAFLKIMGMTPAEYKKKEGEGKKD